MIDAYSIGHIVGRLLMSFILVFVVLLVASKFKFGIALARLKSLPSIVAILLLVLLPLSLKALTADMAQNRFIRAPLQQSMTANLHTVVSPDDTLLITLQKKEAKAELLAVTYFEGKSLVDNAIDTPKEYREFAQGLYKGASKGYKFDKSSIDQEVSWGDWKVFVFKTQLSAEGQKQDANAYAMLYEKGDIVFAVHMMPQGRTIEAEKGALLVSLQDLQLKK